MDKQCAVTVVTLVLLCSFMSCFEGNRECVIKRVLTERMSVSPHERVFPIARNWSANRRSYTEPNHQ